ncbi:MAG TPA: isoprenylcysteine carboxylmethyltransferase family protein [Anaeromyxobacteraceae bacterium]|nr:isoprenylcysteine carboxylmethyltransferase family protein [Anaeromyxobacteraceae bacterium]
MRRAAAYVIFSVAGLLGIGSLIAFLAFLILGLPHSVVAPGADPSKALWLDAGLCLIFFLQHSGLVRRSFRRWSTRFIPEDYWGAAYAISSGMALLALVLLWRGVGSFRLALQGIVRWSFHAILVLSLLVFAWGAVVLGTFDPFGLRSILHRLRGATAKRGALLVRGPYRWIRHPLYGAMILMIWSCPDLTADRLLFNLAFTGWILVGTLLEERDLVADFGAEYRDYQRRVPMLVPRTLGPRWTESSPHRSGVG